MWSDDCVNHLPGLYRGAPELAAASDHPSSVVARSGVGVYFACPPAQPGRRMSGQMLGGFDVFRFERLVDTQSRLRPALNGFLDDALNLVAIRGAVYKSRHLRPTIKDVQRPTFCALKFSSFHRLAGCRLTCRFIGQKDAV